MADGHPPSYQRFPRDLLASLDGETEDFRLRYSYALDRSWDAGAYGVGTLEEWLGWALLSEAPATLQGAYRVALARHTVDTPDGTIVQIRMARDRMEQALRHRAAVAAGKRSRSKRKGRNALKPPSSHPPATP